MNICLVCNILTKNKTFCSYKCAGVSRKGVANPSKRLEVREKIRLGNLGKVVKETTKRKQSQTRTGKPWSEKQRFGVMKSFEARKERTLKSRNNCLVCGSKVKGRNNKYCSNACASTRLIGNTYRSGKKWSEISKALLSKNTKGRPNLKNRGKIPWNKGLTIDLDDRIKSTSVSELHKIKLRLIKTGIPRPPDIRNRISKTNKQLWDDSEYVQKTLKARFTFPNKPEIVLSNVFAVLHLDFVYTGDGRKIVAHSRPDFVCESENKVIELFGCYWHKCLEHFPSSIYENDEQEKILKYLKNGYKCLIIWEHELKDLETVKVKIVNFKES